MLSIIIPAYNEETVIEQCLKSLLDQSYTGQLEIIVVANGCKDRTVELSKKFSAQMAAKGYQFLVLELTEGNKNLALNYADEQARFLSRMYLDADVVCDKHLIDEIVPLLNFSSPRYISGTLEIKKGSSFASQAYGKIWKETPYIRDTVPGCGCYTVNEAGRKLWGQFPMIHSDDKFVRLLFAQNQRKQTTAKYYWPLPQGLITLIKIRVRWIRGNRQLAIRFPELLVNDSKRIRLDRSFVKTILLNPISTLVFLIIYVSAASRVYLMPSKHNIVWSRAR